MRVLVVGGAGYIGSHMVRELLAAGHEVTTFDNLSKGYRDAVTGGEFVQGDLASRDDLAGLFAAGSFEAVMHFASFIEVGESVSEPLRYYRNNVTNTLNLLEAMVEHEVRNLVFSSTAAVYGEPEYTPIDECHPTAPLNPYGLSKLVVENVLRDCDRACGLRSVSLRYFNAAGAHGDGGLGERHDPETHLVPLILQAASGRRRSISIFGDDYDTRDGTCIRDYIHVQDLCAAHLAALDYLRSGEATACFNLGNGAGFSVREVIECAREVTDSDIAVQIEGRRPGDPAVLVADAKNARDILGWQTPRSSLENIVTSAWNWERSFFSG